ncbi:MAG TPA: hypothetical protein VK724_04300 [Bryobacteraceae bacterium]|jgi:hypothetical protein|nr:hypothetical protein [Bryobacteraceae bacterium]
MPQQQADLRHDALARELRAAVLGNEHERAARLATQYTQEVARQWTLMPAAERAASSLPKQSRELLTWARDVAIMHHAMAGQHLEAIGMANRYLAARANYLKSAAL